MKKNIDRLYEKRWGIFHHYLDSYVNDEKSVLSYYTHTEWNECVKCFDVKRLAKQLSEIGVGYYVITLMQGSKFMLAPNLAYDQIAGTKPGEACATRDLPMELAEELAKYDIDLYLYFTGDGPWKDLEIGTKFGFSTERTGNMNMPFVEKWASVLEEYAVRYGDKVKGWWIDGCYDYFAYTNDMLIPYKKAVEKGNPDAIVTFNNGKLGGFECQWELEDYTCGESLEFQRTPEGRFADGKTKQNHMLCALGAAPNPYDRWCKPCASTYDADTVFSYVNDVTKNGGVISIDTAVYRDGWIDPIHYNILKQAGDRLREAWKK